MNPITLMLVDDHVIFRHGIQRILHYEPDLHVIAEAADGAIALQLATQLQPQVMIVDINLPVFNGLQLTQTIKQTMPHIGVIVLTGYYDSAQLIYALEAGANGCLSKDVDPQTFVTIIREVARGRFWLNGQFVSKYEVMVWLARQVTQHDDGVTVNSLSRREMEILGCLAHGLSNKQIAMRLQLSEQTIKNHLNRIQRKLGVSDRTQIVLYALRKGWINPHA